MTKEEQKVWEEGYDAGFKTATSLNERATKIGTVILDVMYELFEGRKEDD